MIEFEKINDKGEKITAYTHKNFLSKHYNEEIVKAELGNKKVAATSFWATGILTYFVYIYIIKGNNSSPRYSFIRPKQIIIQGSSLDCFWYSRSFYLLIRIFNLFKIIKINT